MNRFRIALQLYSVRGDCARSLEETLKAVAGMGYEGVEFAGYYGRTAGELRDMLDSLGLEVAGTHIPVDALVGGRLKDTVEFNRILGNRFLVVPSLPEGMRSSREDWVRTAEFFNKVAGRLKSEGMYVGYHNHQVEFKPLDGEKPWDLFFESTVSDVVMQLDTGNAMQAGVTADELLEILKRYPGRAKTVHLKEYSSTNPKALIGEGEVKWREFLTLCRDIGGTEWYIVEQEEYPYPPLKCAEICLENLKRIISELT